MNYIVDWARRKSEIGAAFRQALPLPKKLDDDFCRALMARLDVSSMQDFAILYNIIEDAIMSARREKRPTASLEAFKDWLQQVRLGRKA